MDDFIDLIPSKKYTFENRGYKLTSWNWQILSNRLKVCAILSANLMLSKFDSGSGSAITTITGYSMSLRTNLFSFPKKLSAKKFIDHSFTGDCI